MLWLGVMWSTSSFMTAWSRGKVIDSTDTESHYSILWHSLTTTLMLSNIELQFVTWPNRTLYGGDNGFTQWVATRNLTEPTRNGWCVWLLKVLPNLTLIILHYIHFNLDGSTKCWKGLTLRNSNLHKLEVKMNFKCN